MKLLSLDRARGRRRGPWQPAPSAPTIAVRYGIREMRGFYGNSPAQNAQRMDKKMPVRLN